MSFFIRALSCILVMSMASCGAAIRLKVQAGGSASLSVDAEIPEQVAKRMSSFRNKQADAGLPLFDASIVAREASKRGVRTVKASSPDFRTLDAQFAVKDLKDLTGNDTTLRSSGLLTTERKEGIDTIRFGLNRDNAQYLPSLFPGIDPYILESLSPPAVEDSPITASEYRSMLESLFGSKAMPEIDAAGIDIVIEVPGRILASSGGTARANVFQARIPVVEALVLENPIAFSLSWRE
jgi:hypothetical protein